MDTSTQRRTAETFRYLHNQSDILLLPNAWDAVSARILEDAGFAAIAASGGGVPWSLGYPADEHVPCGEMVGAMARIARAVAVPVATDIDVGFNTTPAVVAETVAAVIDAGAVGVNLKDGRQEPASGVCGIKEAAARIRAARRAADEARMPIVINARIDVYISRFGTAEQCFAETVRRGNAYLANGADCIQPMGVSETATLSALVNAFDAPVNIRAISDTPDIVELERLGVARVSTGTALTLAAMSELRRIAGQWRETGQFKVLDSSLTHADVRQLLTKSRDVAGDGCHADT